MEDALAQLETLVSENPQMAPTDPPSFQTLGTSDANPPSFRALDFDNNNPDSFQFHDTYNSNPPLIQTLNSDDPTPPETLDFFNRPPPPQTVDSQNPPPPPPDETLAPDCYPPPPEIEVQGYQERMRSAETLPSAPTETLPPPEQSSTSADNPDVNCNTTLPPKPEGAERPLISGNCLGMTHSGIDKDCSGGEDETSSRRRRRRSRWDPPSEPGENGETSSGVRKRKSRWGNEEPKPVPQLPDFMKDFASDLDPEVQALNIRLLEISRRLQSGLPLDDRPEAARSPSPEPIYDNMGIRINTREYRARERLSKERQEIISQLIQRNPAFRPPADYRPPKLQKKLYIPMKEYPGYNFIGLIIGPRGNTQKRMEKETGAKIVIRGKGSIKEGRLLQKKDLKPDPSENDDLHVFVEAETQEALDAAAGMVEKLLRPVDEGLNEHKRQQLRELAALNGTIKEDEFCRLCGEPGHRQYACTSRTITFKSDVLCKICGDGGHPTIDCPVKGTVQKMDDEYLNFLAELGGSGPEFLTKQSSVLPIRGSNTSGSTPPWANGNTAGAGAANGIKKEYDETNLYVGYLPPSLDDDGLIRLFSPFGIIVMAKVVKDRMTGMNKGYGFVKYSDVSMANHAITSMNGYHLEGRSIAVRVAGKPPQPAIPPGPPAPPAPTFPGLGSTTNGPPPPGSYLGAPVPWGPPVPPPYASYALPPPGSSMYTPIQGQHMPPYVVHYHPPPPTPQQTVPPGVPPQTTPTSEAMQNYSPGVQSQGAATLSQPTPSNMFPGSVPGMAPSGPPLTYPPFSVGYTPYYTVVPPTTHPSIDPSQSMVNVSWAVNPPASQSASSSAEQSTTYAADTEYEKFLSEMK